jgi:hypothetical protein
VRYRRAVKTVKRVALGLFATLVLLVAVVVAGGPEGPIPRRLFSDGTDYSRVASIRATREYQDAALLAKAWALPVARAYRDAGLESQRNGSVCGPTSAVDVLKSLGQPANQASVLHGTGVSTFLGFLPGGITLDQLADVLRQKSGRRVTVLRDLDLAAFRAEVARSNDPGRRYVANFHRGPLFGKGGGHHSPIVGYLADEDLVLVADVNARFQPWLVRTERLFAAVDTVDKQSGRKRGLLRIE